MAGEVDRRIPAVGNGEEVAGDPFDAPGRIAHPNGRERLEAVRPNDFGAEHDARALCLRRHGLVDGGAGVDHGRNLNAGASEIGDRAPSVIAARADDRAAPRRDGEVVEIGANGTGEHHPGAIVAGEHHRPLDRARGHDRALRDDAPGALARLMLRRRREMVRHALDRAIGAVVIGTEHARPAQDAHLRQAFELGLGAGRPGVSLNALDLLPLREEAAADREVFLAQDDASAGATGRERRRQPGRT